jgi:Rod binding domain-containing protein
MNPTAAASGSGISSILATNRPPQPPSDEQLQVRQTFQDFVAGTFYKQMFKALRSTENQPAYMHGGKAEEMFQNQMDQQVAENLARDQGSDLVGPLYTTFAAHLRYKLQQTSASAGGASAGAKTVEGTSSAKLGK